MNNLFKQSILILFAAVLVGGWTGKAETTTVPGLYIVACVGDSITQGVGASSSANNYPAQLQEMLGNHYLVQNCGVSGTTLLKEGDSPYTNQGQYQNSCDCDPNIVIIMLGTNDSKPQNWKYKDKYLSELVSLIHVYQNLESKPMVYVATSPTVYAPLSGITDAVVSNEVVPLQKEAARETGCEIIDINTLTKNHADWTSDGVHPNDKGYPHLTSAFADVLSKRYDSGIVAQLITRLNTLPQNPDASHAAEVEVLQSDFSDLSSRQTALVTDQQWAKLANAVKSVKTLTTTTKHQSPTTKQDSSATKTPVTGTSASSTTSLDSAIGSQTDVTADTTTSLAQSSTSAISAASTTAPRKSSSFILFLISGIVLAAAAVGGAFVWLRKKHTAS